MFSIQSHILFAERLVKLLDTKYKILGITFGIDPFLNFWPAIGNFIGVGMSCYLFWIAIRLNVKPHIYIKMIWNILLDFVLGAIPYAGFIFDLLYRANVKNLALLKPYVHSEVLVGKVV